MKPSGPKKRPRGKFLDALWIDTDAFGCPCRQHQAARAMLRERGLKGKWKVTFRAEPYR
jgi:hypothetical protein